MSGRRTPQVHNKRMLSMIIGWVCVLAVVLGACSDDGGTGGVSSPTTSPRNDLDKPSWVESVYPPDGAQSATEAAVEVEYNAIDPGREIRIVIDGVDITSQATGIDRGPSDDGVFPSPGTLRYDPTGNERALVNLEPGDHLATVKLVESSFGDASTTVDEYDWSFTIQ